MRFDESLMWQAMVEDLDLSDDLKKIPFNYDIRNSYVDVFQTSKYLKDTTWLNDNFKKSIILLESFRNGLKEASEVFDINKLSTFFALSDILGAQHGLAWHNIRFYFNNFTSKLEPIAFDGNAGKIFNSFAAFENSKSKRSHLFSKILFKDNIFHAEYIQKLNKFSNVKFLNKKLDELKFDIDQKTKLLNKEWPLYRFDPAEIRKNQDYAKKVLSPPKSIHSYMSKINSEKVKLSFSNVYSIPLEVKGIKFERNKFYNFEKHILLEPFLKDQVINYDSLIFNIDELGVTSFDSAKIGYSFIGIDSIMYEEIFFWDPINYSVFKNQILLKPANHLEFDFINVNEKNKIIVFDHENINISKDLILPSGYKIIINQNSTIDITNSSMILSRSPLFVNGSKEYPVEIITTDTTGQGVLVLNTGIEKSVLNYVNIKYLSNPKRKNWEITGAITFYNSNVIFSNSNFLSNVSGDDYINVVRSNFEFSNLFFDDVFADAFDADFCKGYISNLIFNNIGNDGVDVSGTSLEFNNLTFKNIEDKAISVGENSHCIGDEVKIHNANIGIAVKDLSTMKVSQCNITKSQIGVAIFQKKSEYGPAKMIGNNFSLYNVNESYLVENESVCQINQKTIVPNSKNMRLNIY